MLRKAQYPQRFCALNFLLSDWLHKQCAIHVEIALPYKVRFVLKLRPVNQSK